MTSYRCFLTYQVKFILKDKVIKGTSYEGQGGFKIYREQKSIRRKDLGEVYQRSLSTFYGIKIR